MSSKKLYITKQDFLKNATNFLDKNTPIGTQTGWKEFTGGYVHYVDGHMENDPILGVSVLKYGIDGNLKTEEFREKGHRHKSDGPAVVEYSSNGSVLKQEYYISGIQYSETQFYSNAKKLKPTFLEIGNKQIKISDLEKRFGSFLKKDSNGLVTNVKALTAADKHQSRVKYDELDKETIYVNDSVVFKNVYDGITPNAFSISYDGSLIDPRYFKNPHEEIVSWETKAFQPSRKETKVPLWIELQEFPKLGIEPGTNIPEYDSTNINKVLQDFLSPFNKDTILSYVYQDNFFHILKDPSIGVVFEKRIPLRPKLVKDDTEIDMSWEEEPTTFKKGGYVAGITSKPIEILKKEYEVNCEKLSKQQRMQKQAVVQKNQQFVPQTTSSAYVASNITSNPFQNITLYSPTVSSSFVPTLIGSSSYMPNLPGEVKTAAPGLEQSGSYSITNNINITGNELLQKILKQISKHGFHLVPEIKSNGTVEFKVLENTKISQGSGSVLTIPNLENGNQYVTTNKIELTETVRETPSKIVEIAKSDAKEVAKRIAAKQITSFVHNMLVEFMTKKQKKAKSEIETFFMSEKGKVVLGLAVGATIPLITNYFPEKYKDALLEISSEFRVQAETEIALGVTETVITPFLSELGSGVAAFQLFSGNNAEKVRVAVDGDLTAAPTGSIEDESEVLGEIPSGKTNQTLN